PVPHRAAQFAIELRRGVGRDVLAAQLVVPVQITGVTLAFALEDRTATAARQLGQNQVHLLLNVDDRLLVRVGASGLVGGDGLTTTCKGGGGGQRPATPPHTDQQQQQEMGLQHHSSLC